MNRIGIAVLILSLCIWVRVRDDKERLEKKVAAKRSDSLNRATMAKYPRTYGGYQPPLIITAKPIEMTPALREEIELDARAEEIAEEYYIHSK